jgi:hypothetical protein
MTYIDLVNFALRESGSTLDQLTTSPTDTWTTPTDNLYTKFKQWVKQAWVDIQTDRRDWEYMQDTGVYLLKPRMHVYAGRSNTDSATLWNSAAVCLHDYTATPILTTDSTNAFTVVSGSIAAGTATAEGYLTVLSFDEDFLIEPGDELSIDGDSVSRCFFKRWGYYDFSQTVGAGLDGISDLAEVDLGSMQITNRDYSATQSQSSVSWDKIKYVNRNDWVRYGYDRPVSVAKPHSFTTNRDGTYSFYPPPDDWYHLTFGYYRTPQEFSAAADTPTGLPARFHDAIAWRALLYYGQFDGINRIAQIAAERYKKFEYEMVRDLLPETKVGYDARKW